MKATLTLVNYSRKDTKGIRVYLQHSLCFRMEGRAHKCHVRQGLAFSIGIIGVPDEKGVEEFELKYDDDGE